MKNEVWQEPGTQKLLSRVDFLFIWLRIFYPHFKGMKNYYLFFYFFPQKILRINGSCRWPVHFTSRVLYSKNIKVGINSAPGLSNGCYIQGKNGIYIGNNLRMGPGVGLISANHNPDNYDQWLKVKPIEIGDNVWIGMNAIILPGITIGHNVIIGANSVVNKNIPSNTINAGNPAVLIRSKLPYGSQKDEKVV
jgi:acetyltransferase-like isoleucine patch superfamily enzyme